MNAYTGPISKEGKSSPGHFDDGDGESSVLFYARCSMEVNFRDVRRIVLLCPSLSDARMALESRGLVVHVLAQAQSPEEPDFSYRPDGTLLVGASKQAERLLVFGPFNDESDARNWISLQHKVKDRSFTTIEPDECLHYKRINGVLTEIVMPDDLMQGPTTDF